MYHSWTKHTWCLSSRRWYVNVLRLKIDRSLEKSWLNTWRIRKRNEIRRGSNERICWRSTTSSSHLCMMRNWWKLSSSFRMLVLGIDLSININTGNIPTNKHIPWQSQAPRRTQQHTLVPRNLIRRSLCQRSSMSWRTEAGKAAILVEDNLIRALVFQTLMLKNSSSQTLVNEGMQTIWIRLNKHRTSSLIQELDSSTHVLLIGIEKISEISRTLKLAWVTFQNQSLSRTAGKYNLVVPMRE